MEYDKKISLNKELQHLNNLLEEATKTLRELELQEASVPRAEQEVNFVRKLKDQKEKVEKIQNDIVQKQEELLFLDPESKKTENSKLEENTSKIRGGDTDFFVNRNRELVELSKDTCPPFIILRDPAGYGKTYLLKKLHSNFSSIGGHKSVYINFDETPQARTSIYNFLCCFLNIVDTKIRIPEGTSLAWLQNQISGNLGHFSYKNVLVIIDSLDLLSNENEVLAYIWNDFVRTLSKSLQGAQKFRVIFSGRYIESLWKGDWKHNLRKLQIGAGEGLAPFDENVVVEAIRVICERKNKHAVSDLDMEIIAREVVQVSGGNPKCIMQILNELDTLNFKINLDINSSTYYFSSEIKRKFIRDYIDPELDVILRGVSPSVREALIVLSAFRGFNSSTILALAKASFIKWSDTPSSLLTALVSETHLITGPNEQSPLFSDRIARLMLVSKLQNDNNGFDYNKITQFAIDLYKQWNAGLDVDGSTLPNRPSDQLQLFLIKEGLYHYCEWILLRKVNPVVALNEIRDYLTSQVKLLISPFGENGISDLVEQLKNKVEADAQVVSLLNKSVGYLERDQLMESL
ncbi:MAG: hypothetical protein H3C41_11150 [Bacteroidales bacterium]|nr:hypothetical protein [Bacteroidales bacterium]